VNRPRLLAVSIPRRADLERAYMSWLKRGGLFVPTAESYRLGDPIYLLLSLPGQLERFSVDGEVVWIVPNTNDRNTPPGIGVHFSDSDGSRNLRSRIETMLADQAA
jgi:type IV pilus assembly protein PilZ